MIKKIISLAIVLLPIVATAQENNLTRIESLLLDARYEEALQLIEASMAQSDNPSLLNIKKAETLIKLGKLTDGETLLKKTVDALPENKKTYHQALIATNFGSLYLNQGRFDLGTAELEKAIKFFESDGKSNSLEAADALSYLGNLYVASGKYQQAEEQLQMALAIRTERLPETHELIAASYNNLGLAYTQIDVDKAFEYYEKALEMYEKLHGSEHPKLAIANTNLGVLHRSEKLYGDAIVYFESALKVWEKIYAQPHPNKAMVLMNLGLTYSSMGNAKVALEYYEKAKTMYEVSQGKKHPDVAYIYNLLGNQKTASQNFDEALIDYQRAMIANIPAFNSENIYTNPPTANFYNGISLLYTLMYKAETLEGKYLGKSLKDSDLTLGIKTLQVADTLIDRLRQHATNESDKITLGAIANEVYAHGVRMTEMLSNVALKNRRSYRELSFYFAEKSKSAVLLEAISDTDAKSFAKIPSELLEEEKSLKSAIALISQKLAQKPDDQEEKYLRETIFGLNRSYRDFTKRLENQYPEYFNLKFNSASPSIGQLQAIMPDETALISYFIDEKNNRLYIYCISKRKFTIESKTMPAAYDKYITGLRNGLYFMEENAFRTASRNLHKLLIPKLPASINDLVIIPTGRMGIIPFETLLTKDAAKNSSFKDMPYLLNRFSIRYEFSAGLVLQKKKETQTTKASAMLCAPVTFPEKENLSDLPGTESEVNAIANLFKEKNIGNRIYLKGQASEAAIKSGALKDYSLIHFATHGVVDENNPELSRIFLQSDSDAEDGNLFAGEIYNLELNANLVALSACQTGLGKISKGEGVIGLSRALVYAGAKNIIVSFWSVADESTSQLMTDFYKQLLENPNNNYSHDLRQAKLNLLKDGNYAAPYYWAPFILIGF